MSTWRVLTITVLLLASAGTATAQTITEYPIPTPNSGPFGIAAGFDLAAWFTEISANKIGRITTAGAISEFSLPPAPSGPVVTRPSDITAGPDGALWFIWGPGANKIGRITT